jgi:prepilin-type N-terminal cleavage/methylation domain-containing protein
MVIKKGINKFKNKAFTLVELLVVMSIMGILTIMVSSSFKTVQMKARDTRRKSDLNAISKALNTYFVDYGVYPEDGEDSLIKLDSVGNDFFYNDILYIKELPVEETRNIENYVYITSDGGIGGSGKSFRLFAELENEDDSGCFSDFDYCPDDYNGVEGKDNCCYGVSSPNIGMGGTMI